MGLICPLTRLFSDRLTVVSNSEAPTSASRLEEKPPVHCGSVKEGECLYPKKCCFTYLKGITVLLSR